MRLNNSNCTHNEMTEQTVELTGERNQETFVVRVPGLVCTQCGFATLSNKQSGRFTQAVSDAYRTAHGLLTSQELKKLRHQRAMSQSEFAQYLGVGVASIKRWEAGQIQDKAMDELIRLKTDPAAALRNAHELNPPVYQYVDVETVQIYHRQRGISLDISELESKHVLGKVAESVAA